MTKSEALESRHEWMEKTSVARQEIARLKSHIREGEEILRSALASDAEQLAMIRELTLWIEECGEATARDIPMLDRAAKILCKTTETTTKTKMKTANH